MVDKYEMGRVVKSNQRTKGFPLFLLILEYPMAFIGQFTATVIFNKEPGPEEDWDRGCDIGRVSTDWNQHAFDKSSWQELKEWL